MRDESKSFLKFHDRLRHKGSLKKFDGDKNESSIPISLHVRALSREFFLPYRTSWKIWGEGGRIQILKSFQVPRYPSIFHHYSYNPTLDELENFIKLQGFYEASRIPPASDSCCSTNLYSSCLRTLSCEIQVVASRNFYDPSNRFEQTTMAF